MAKSPPETSSPEILRRLKVGETHARVNRLELDAATPAIIQTVLRAMRDKASSDISRATADGRTYHRDSTVTLDEQHNPLVTVLITRLT